MTEINRTDALAFKAESETGTLNVEAFSYGEEVYVDIEGGVRLESIRDIEDFIIALKKIVDEAQDSCW